MKGIYICCVGSSHTSYQIVGVKETQGAAEALLRARLTQIEFRDLVNRDPVTDCGFYLPTIYNGDIESESDVPQWVWDFRLKRQVLNRTGAKAKQLY